MKKIALLAVAAFLLSFYGGFAQESVEQYLMGLKDPKEEDYIKLLYEGSRENKLFALNKLLELGARSEAAKEAYIFGLHQGTLIVDRAAGRVTNDFWDVRALSAKALGGTGDPAVLGQLHNALRYDPDTYVRTAVAVAIGKIGDRRSVPDLARALEFSRPGSTEDTVILGCVIALGEIGDKDGFVPLVEVIRGNYNRNIKLAARESLKKIRW